MELEKQVCSLELAKRLKEFGVKQESYFYWVKYNNVSSEYTIVTVEGVNFDKSYLISAFTVAELGEILPKYIHSAKGDDKNFKWECCHDCRKGYFSKSGAETEADARAKMLIYLIENGIVKSCN